MFRLFPVVVAPQLVYKTQARSQYICLARSTFTDLHYTCPGHLAPKRYFHTGAIGFHLPDAPAFLLLATKSTAEFDPKAIAGAAIGELPVVPDWWAAFQEQYERKADRQPAKWKRQTTAPE